MTEMMMYCTISVFAAIYVSFAIYMNINPTKHIMCIKVINIIIFHRSTLL